MKPLNKIFYPFSVALIATSLLSGYSDDTNSSQQDITVEQDSNVKQQDPNHDSHAVADFTPDYISASDLNQRFNDNAIPLIFDVRSLLSFEQSHIESAISMPYGKIQDTDLVKITVGNKDSEIITYCGCPRHISTLTTQDLIARGYTNVKVLYEGYWHWKDNNFPIVETVSSAKAITKLTFHGLIAQNDSPLNNVDLFLEHKESGQLEAVRTNSNGNFKIDFRLFGYQPGDRFNLMIADLNSTPVLELTPENEISTYLNIKL